MSYSVFSKLLLFILRFIQSHYKSYVHFLENGYIVFWSERAIPVSHIEWSGKCHELARQNPIQVTVFYFFKMLILLNIKRGVVVPSKRNCELQPLEAVQV